MKFRFSLAALLTLLPVLTFAQSHKGISLQLYILKPNGQPMNQNQLSVRTRVLSTNDCVLVDETHSNVDIVNGYMRIAVGQGVRSGSDKGLSLVEALSNANPKAGLDSVSGGTGNCNVTPSAQDARKLKVTFNVGSDPVEANFTVRSSAYAVVADEAQTLQGKLPSAFLQNNSSKNLTQSKLEDFFNAITTQVGKVIKFDGTNFVATDSGLSPSWSSITDVPSPLSQVAGLSCADEKVLKYQGGSIVCGSDNDTIPQAMEWGAIVGKPETFAPSAHGHYYTDLQNSVGGFLTYKPNNAACSSNQVLAWDQSTGAWTCGLDQTSFATKSELTDAVSNIQPPDMSAYLKADGTQDMIANNGFELTNADVSNYTAFNSMNDPYRLIEMYTTASDGSSSDLYIASGNLPWYNDDPSTVNRTLISSSANYTAAPIALEGSVIEMISTESKTSFMSFNRGEWLHSEYGFISKSPNSNDLIVASTSGKVILQGTSVSANNTKISDVANGVSSTDAVNKGQLDAAIQGVQPSASTLSGVLPIAHGGTGNGDGFMPNSMLITDGTGSRVLGYTCSIGQMMKWEGTQWSCSYPLSSIIAGTGLTGGTISTSGTIAVDVGTTAGKIVQLDSSGKLPAVNGSQLTGFGTAAFKDVGGFAGNVVQLDSNGKLPPVNASNVTGLTATQIPSLDASKITTGNLSLTGDITGGNITATKQISGATVAATANATSLDFASGNTVTSANTCAATIALSNLKDGGSYTFVNTDTTTTTQCNFSSTGLTFKFSPANGVRVSGTMTVYSFLRAGTFVFVSWGTGFQ